MKHMQRVVVMFEDGYKKEVRTCTAREYDRHDAETTKRIWDGYAGHGNITDVFIEANNVYHDRIKWYAFEGSINYRG